MESQSWLMLSASHLDCTSPCGPIFSLSPARVTSSYFVGVVLRFRSQEAPCFQSYRKQWSQVAFAATFTEKGITHATLKLSSRLMSTRDALPIVAVGLKCPKCQLCNPPWPYADLILTTKHFPFWKGFTAIKRRVKNTNCRAFYTKLRWNLTLTLNVNSNPNGWCPD